MSLENFLGSGKSFPDEQIRKSLQPIVGSGYKNCERRTYLFRCKEHTPKHAATVLMKPGDPYISLINHGVLSFPSARFALFKLLAKSQKIIAERLKSSQFSWDIALTFEGLKKLRVKPEILHVFKKKSPAFCADALERAIRHLGDTGASSPDYWDSQYRRSATDSVDVILVVHFPFIQNGHPDYSLIKIFETNLIQHLLELEVNPSDQQIDLSSKDWVEISKPLSGGKEHFGYRDGITSPVYAEKAAPDQGIHTYGEILLGWKKNDKSNPYADLEIPYREHDSTDPKVISEKNQEIDFFRNSSFAVFRKMHQDVDVFNRWIDMQAVQLKKTSATQFSGTDLELIKQWIRAKIMGRTQEGLRLTPMVLPDDMDTTRMKDLLKKISPEIQGKEGGFRKDAGHPLWAEDAKGEGCPFASHIRRMNPQDDPMTPFIHRPLLRRGLPYTYSKDDRGLAGLFLCSDIADQFEHLVGIWAQESVMGIKDQSTSRDPILGMHESQNNEFILHSRRMDPSDKPLKFEQPFVTTKGSVYAWFPSLHALNNFSQYTD